MSKGTPFNIYFYPTECSFRVQVTTSVLTNTLSRSSWHECSVTSLANVMPTDTKAILHKRS